MDKGNYAKALKLLLRLNTDTTQFSPLIPSPSTDGYTWASENGYISVSYKDYCKKDAAHNCVLELPNLSSNEMVAFCADAGSKYYVRPKYTLYRLVIGLKAPEDLKRFSKAFERLNSTYL
ncbi:hypothetical protein [Enterocloster hominis (ex Hitch et al. 2024)]|uniref:hypothetical protein n=1 Tax=Enterocloster hominis (ex Hitch et al. 2024) TaxID=1917870 RepID=UPI00124327C9|nr:hypothetical protein [Lachnoclostridium pacaense]